MIRLHVVAEGQTEQAFVEKVLASHLASYNVHVHSRCVLTSRDKRASKEYRGGMTTYKKAKNDIQNWIKEDNHAACRFTTMFDLYALPQDFPGYPQAPKRDPYARVKFLEQRMEEDIDNRLFIPYIQLHEFEALIFADPQQLDWEYLEHDQAIKNLIDMVADQNPELINDGPTTSPSKRIHQEIPEYDKVTAGVSVAQRIGLPTLREKCQHFNEWLTILEKLDKGAT